MNYWTQSEKNIYVAAHRGWSGKYPENTMEAFRGALELDVDQLETDVRVTADGELILLHDATVDRTTNGSGLAREMTFSQLRALDAGSWKDSRFAHCRIPTLREFMELVKDHPTIPLDIELKEYPIEGRDALSYSVCDRVIAMLEEYNFLHRCVINSWNGKLHEYILTNYGDRCKQHVYFPQRYLGECTRDPYEYAYCTCVCGITKGETTVEEAVELHKRSGVRLWAGTYAKNEENINLAMAFGAELITCNHPDEVLEILRRKGVHR